MPMKVILGDTLSSRGGNTHEIAKEAGLDYQKLRRLISGKSKMVDLDFLAEVCEKLNVSLSEIIIVKRDLQRIGIAELDVELWAINLYVYGENNEGYYYQIDMDRARTIDEVKGWIRHLRNKLWFSTIVEADLKKALTEILKQRQIRQGLTKEQEELLNWLPSWE